MPFPQSAKPARKSARCGVCDGSQRPYPPHGEHAAPSQVGGNRTGPPPLQAIQTEHGAETGHLEWHGPRGTALPAPSTGIARGAGATPTRGGGGGAHTHTMNTRGKPEGQPDQARGTHRPHGMAYQRARIRTPRRDDPPHTARKSGAGRGKWGRHNTRHGPNPREPAASAAQTGLGYCIRQGSSGPLRHGPAPWLGSLCASPRRSHWRRASSTGPAAPTPRATTHQGGDAVPKRLQPQLLSDALTGEWQNGEAGGGTALRAL